MHADQLLKISVTVFAVLFFINWICTLSAQQVSGFRWGDFVIILILSAGIFFNLDRLRTLAAVIPDATDLLSVETRTRLEDVQGGLRDTRETANAVSEYLRGVARREMEYQMQLSVPPRKTHEKRRF